ncbi:zinc finger X-chromosomal protein isoform X2 [Nilaparvata lugens]|uniref:zinc finger X-chromosomal protein isoform X2 n=1 Tax=Nilaparvata lugens TaxID=108931 RepID=UPI00193EAFC1|nr:zinc finger X-chromosomal protein isoform X2 [Nilaparvata lugens]
MDVECGKEAQLQCPYFECFKCKQCGKSYRHRSSLNKHVKNECGKDPQMQCPYCSHRTKHKGNLKSHIVAKHLTNF